MLHNLLFIFQTIGNHFQIKLIICGSILSLCYKNLSNSKLLVERIFIKNSNTMELANFTKTNQILQIQIQMFTLRLHHVKPCVKQKIYKKGKNPILNGFKFYYH